jgi:hypothetical protein
MLNIKGIWTDVKKRPRDTGINSKGYWKKKGMMEKEREDGIRKGW